MISKYNVLGIVMKEYVLYLISLRKIANFHCILNNFNSVFTLSTVEVFRSTSLSREITL